MRFFLTQIDLSCIRKKINKNLKNEPNFLTQPFMKIMTLQLSGFLKKS